MTFLVFAAFFATAPHAFADTGIPDTGAIEATVDPTIQAPPVPTSVTQDAATGQGATAGAIATQPQQSNSITTAPTDSSGAVNASQQNEAAVTGAAANGASTSQAAGSVPIPDGQPSGADQQAATDQAANAAAAVLQPQQSNVVIIIRVNSPGDDDISQTNVVSVVGAAGNQSSTSQQGPTTQDPAPAGAPASGTSDPTRSQPAGGPTPPTDGPPQSSGAVPQSAQSATAAQQLVQPANAVQGQRSHGARALSILSSAGGSNANPSAPEHQAATLAKTTSPAPGWDRSSAGPSTTSGSVATPVSKGGSVASRSTKPSRTKAEPIRYHIADWLRGAGAALSPRPSSGRGLWAIVGLMTLSALIAGGLGWILLTWMPSLRGAPRFRIGPW